VLEREGLDDGEEHRGQRLRVAAAELARGHALGQDPLIIRLEPDEALPDPRREGAPLAPEPQHQVEDDEHAAPVVDGVADHAVEEGRELTRRAQRPVGDDGLGPGLEALEYIRQDVREDLVLVLEVLVDRGPAEAAESGDAGEARVVEAGLGEYRDGLFRYLLAALGEVYDFRHWRSLETGPSICPGFRRVN
jgi:hypothetical protein